MAGIVGTVGAVNAFRAGRVTAVRVGFGQFR
jgi:hypothetical protein